MEGLCPWESVREEKTADFFPAGEEASCARLVAALLRGDCALLLQAEECVPADWLTEARIATLLAQALLDPVPVQLWQLRPRLWAISLRLATDAGSPDAAMILHLAQRALSQSLEADWRKQAQARPALRILPPALPPENALPEEAAPALSLQLIEAEETTTEPDAEAPRAQAPAGAAGEPSPAFRVAPIGEVTGIADIQDNIAELNHLLEIIVNRQLHAQFQPIISLKTGLVIGYEALIRGPKGALLRRPGAMFCAANKARVVAWFDAACQEQCLALAAQQKLRHLLFINMDAEGLAYMDVQDRPLSVCAAEVGIPPSSIVIEITERQAVNDFPRLVQYIAKLREQGFKIAIDDAGAGYNSLHAIAELRPEFVKIDRALVRDIDVNGPRRALLAAFVQYASQIGTTILAEGAETREELATLIELGVSYGQGYLMGKPADDLRGVPRETREFIRQRAWIRSQTLTGQSVTVGGIAHRGKAASPETPLSEVGRWFAKDSSLTSIVVVENELPMGLPMGLLMRRQWEHVLEMTAAASIGAMLSEETISGWLRSDVLFLEADCSLLDAAKRVTTRTDLSLESDIIIVGPDRAYAGLLTTRALLEAATATQESRQRAFDPLTGLPGRLALEQALRERLLENAPLAVLRVDIHRLEPINRHYGPACGDGILRETARLLERVAMQEGTSEDFLASLGGDDFALLTQPDAAERVCRALLAGFESLAAQFLAQEDRRKGHLDVETRPGMTQREPLMRLRIAGQTNRKRRLPPVPALLDQLDATLRAMQDTSRSVYLLDRFPDRSNRG